jgi:hypothetical protein
MDRFAMDDFISQFANRSFDPSVHHKLRFSLTGFCLLPGSSFQIDNYRLKIEDYTSTSTLALASTTKNQLIADD